MNLKAFQKPNFDLDISVELSSMGLEFVTTGDLDKIRWPGTALAPKRKDGLWKSTCFEFFWGERSMPSYRELNLSPSGDWNVYSFSGPRQGMKEDEAFSSLNSEIKKGYVKISFPVDVKNWDLGFSAVIEGTDSSIYYFSIQHGKKPDFHDRTLWVRI